MIKICLSVYDDPRCNAGIKALLEENPYNRTLDWYYYKKMLFQDLVPSESQLRPIRVAFTGFAISLNALSYNILIKNFIPTFKEIENLKMGNSVLIDIYPCNDVSDALKNRSLHTPSEIIDSYEKFKELTLSTEFKEFARTTSTIKIKCNPY